MQAFLAKLKAFFASLIHDEELALEPIAVQAVNTAVSEAPELVAAGLSQPGNALKIAGAALQKVGEQAAAQALTISTQTAMVEVSAALAAHPANSGS